MVAGAAKIELSSSSHTGSAGSQVHGRTGKGPMPGRRFGLLIVAVAAVAVGSALAAWFLVRDAKSSQPPDDPVAFLQGVVGDIAANHYGRAWQTLHPRQKLVVTKDFYVRCEQLSPIPGHLASIKALRVFDEPIAIAGGDRSPVASTAVTFRLRVAAASPGNSVTLTHTVHAVAVAKRWTWIMPADRFRLYSSKTCF